MDVVMKIVKTNGLFGLYAGLESTFWRYGSLALPHYLHLQTSLADDVPTDTDMCSSLMMAYLLLLLYTYRQNC